nr:RecName: Full=Uncharacterized protein IMPP15 [Nautilus macromphalus]
LGSPFGGFDTLGSNR